MPKLQLTQSFVDTAICETNSSKTDYYDSKVSGLILKVLQSGKRNFYIRYQNERGKWTEKKISSVDASVLKLSDARTLAQQHLSSLAMGNDPFAKKAELKQVPTLADFIANSYMPFIKVNKRSWVTDESLLRNHVIPAFGHLYMDEFTPQHLMSFISEHRKTHANGSVNRVVIILRYIFNLALRWKVAGLSSNPTANVPLLEEHNHKERFLSPEETTRLMDAVKQSDNKMLQFIIPMLIMTGARKREVLDLKWADLDLVKRQWRLAEADNKSKKVRHIPLSEGVLAILDQVPRFEGCPYVFPNEKTLKPFVSIFSSWDTARKKADLADVRVHDLRHSFASFLVNAGCPIYEVKELLGHSQIKTTQRYAHLSQDTLLMATNKVSSIIAAASSGMISHVVH